MDFSLANYPNRYNLSYWGTALSLVTGAPYGTRHFECAQVANGKTALAHRIIGAIEYLPLLGSIIGLLERIAVAVASCFVAKPETKAWEPRNLSVETAHAKMERNAKKAIFEHRAISGDSAYVRLGEVEEPSEVVPMKFTHGVAELQGVRDAMEDAHFYRETAQGVLAGVFDGHGGAEVSKYASAQFERRFQGELRKAGGNVHTAFESMMGQIHQEVLKNRAWNHQGCTAVVCYVDKASGKVYTATLGDSEANIYRKVGDKTKSVPLSCVRDWWSKKDFTRLCAAHGRTEMSVWQTFRAHHPKALRSQLEWGGTNVSRAIGDKSDTWTQAHPLVLSKPKITVTPVKEGDRLVLACDGVKDYVPEHEITKLVDQHEGNATSFANRLVNYALNEKNSEDNISALVIDIAKAPKRVGFYL